MSDEPVLDQCNLVVADMEATVAFYRRLGLTIPETDPAWGDHHRSVETPGGIDLDFDSEQFVGTWNEGWPARRPAVVLGFKVSTRAAVDKVHAELAAAGYVTQQPPYDAFWGSRYAIVEDPDGNAVGIMSPRDPDARSATPTP